MSGAKSNKKSHSEREAEIAKRLGLRYTKDLPSSAKDKRYSGVDERSVSTRRTKKK